MTLFKVDFASVLETSNSQSPEIIKGITTEEELQASVALALDSSLDGNFHLEPDMRALYNPTHINNIKTATQDLLNKITCCCPQCETPGFSITERMQGLPCEICYQPTDLTMAVIYQCQKCNFINKRLYPQYKHFADPSLCSYCNP